MIPQNYVDRFASAEMTERAIKAVKDMFQQNLSAQLTLLRVTAPMMVLSGTGINDELNGVEKPVSFTVRGMGSARVEVVHSLAKWKRIKLARLGTEPGRGIYTDMNALRPDEVLDNIHSIYVDQWDWEKVIRPQDRTIDFLKSTIRRIYESVKVTENRLFVDFPQIVPMLPEDITFITAEELRRLYPGLTPKARENEICRKFKAVFIIGIGWELEDGKPHDGRAADYDDWNLNGDMLLWNDILQSAFEISSMGIRVDPESLRKQLEHRGQYEAKKNLQYHRELLAGRLPLTIGGGIGQSRLCMYLLRKAHIGEIQAGLWPEDMRRECLEAGIHLL